MAKLRPTCVIAAFAATLCAVSGVAPAHADPIEMAPKANVKVARDGWQLNITLDHEVVDPVPNLAAASESHEAFVTVSATATATGGSSPITDSLFVLGYQLGCQSDVSAGLQMGISIGIIPTGSFQRVVQPGVNVDLPLANMALNRSGRAMLDVEAIHVKADGCGGPVAIRSFAYLRISTQDAHTESAVYGDPINI